MKAAIYLGLATALCLAPVAQACCCVPHYSSVTKREFKKKYRQPISPPRLDCFVPILFFSRLIFFVYVLTAAMCPSPLPTFRWLLFCHCGHTLPPSDTTMTGLNMEYNRCKAINGVYHEDMQENCAVECAEEPVPEPNFVDKDVSFVEVDRKAFVPPPVKKAVKEKAAAGSGVPDPKKSIKAPGKEAGKEMVDTPVMKVPASQLSVNAPIDVADAGEGLSRLLQANLPKPNAPEQPALKGNQQACCCIHPPPGTKAEAESHPVDPYDGTDAALCGDQGGSVRDDIVPPVRTSAPGMLLSPAGMAAPPLLPVLLSRPFLCISSDAFSLTSHLASFSHSSGLLHKVLPVLPLLLSSVLN